MREHSRLFDYFSGIRTRRLRTRYHRNLYDRHLFRLRRFAIGRLKYALIIPRPLRLF